MPNCREDSTEGAQPLLRCWVRSSVKSSFKGDPADAPVQINVSLVNFAGTEVCMQLYYMSTEGLLCKVALALQRFLIVTLQHGFISTNLRISQESTKTSCLSSSVCIGRDMQACSGQLCMVWKVLKVVFWCPSWTVLMTSMHTLQNQSKICIEFGIRSSVGQYWHWASAQRPVCWSWGPAQQEYYPLVSASVSKEVNSLNGLLKPLSLICGIFGLY